MNHHKIPKFIFQLLYARHYSKCFICNNLFNTPINAINYMLPSSLFYITDKETRRKNDQVACLTRSISKWRAPDESGSVDPEPKLFTLLYLDNLKTKIYYETKT